MNMKEEKSRYPVLMFQTARDAGFGEANLIPIGIVMASAADPEDPLEACRGVLATLYPDAAIIFACRVQYEEPVDEKRKAEFGGDKWEVTRKPGTCTIWGDAYREAKTPQRPKVPGIP